MSRLDSAATATRTSSACVCISAERRWSDRTGCCVGADQPEQGAKPPMGFTSSGLRRRRRIVSLTAIQALTPQRVIRVFGVESTFRNRASECRRQASAT
jgi:hypothetical protein